MTTWKLPDTTAESGNCLYERKLPNGDIERYWSTPQAEEEKNKILLWESIWKNPWPPQYKRNSRERKILLEIVRKLKKDIRASEGYLKRKKQIDGYWQEAWGQLSYMKQFFHYVKTLLKETKP